MIRYSEFDGKVVVVSGAASGIGQAQAEAFLAQGATVIGLDQQSMEEKKAFIPYKVDLSDKSQIEKIAKKILKRYPHVDILVNTAGILDGYSPTLSTSEELWMKVFQINVTSIYRLTNLFLPQMLKRQAGVVVNMASIAGLIAGGGGAAYTMAKHAVVGYTKQLALDYAKEGIRVNALAPGAIKTPMNAADFAGEGTMAKWVAEETPLNRWAEPQEVANATLFLASEGASYLQGVVLPVDGGWILK
ncbi:3-oxoacyl-ACP reductase [Candidatus Enterococcus ferrettii]|uniref:3-oxoacyl-[acyl-carrier protein] reductase n=1 Tax=Candidatus Enterococcus ferrettii TaxID=2815324 RepID=A0ABV0EMQ4_9ENTE|nr:3-oxoacyl-ACP reductase [Enterococcus sp. 665A]MBO1339204.1 3-oxoacyl-ACP reductase [Enterococcus sp. 665A]